MITRKDNLLTQPFQRRKFIQHRQKVKNALPRIDDIAPLFRSHVYIKSKKQQTENERQNQIERDNFTLLKHLNDIMTAKRIDNTWICELPKFQSRIKLFHSRLPKVVSEDIPMEKEKYKKSLKDKCIACYPEKFITPLVIPEERVPWEAKSLNKYNLRTEKINKSSTNIKLKNMSNETEMTKFKVPEIKRPILRRCKAKDHLINCRCKSAPQICSEIVYKVHHMSNNRPLSVVMKFPATTNVKQGTELRS